MKRRPLKPKGAVGLCPACHTDLGDPPETQRDRHARAALNGFLSSPELYAVPADKMTERCYRIANSMMEARKK